MGVLLSEGVSLGCCIDESIGEWCYGTCYSSILEGGEKVGFVLWEAIYVFHYISSLFSVEL